MRTAHSPSRPRGGHPSPPRLASVPRAIVLAVVAGAALVACGGGAEATPAVTPGTPDHPRNVIILAKDYTYVPPILDLVPGESVILQVVNGGLAVHEVVIGTADVQDAWEAAEAATIGAPPGPTPAVSVPPGLEGLRVVVASGERVDVAWTVPAVERAASTEWLVGCHIPGHWAQGMVIPIRFIDAAGQPLTMSDAPGEP